MTGTEQMGARMGKETMHHLITGRTGSGKTRAVRTRLGEEMNNPDAASWIIDPDMGLVEFDGKADRYAHSGNGIDKLIDDLEAEITDRSARLAELNITEFVPNDPRHGYPLITVTVEAGREVLMVPRYRAVIQEAVVHGRGIGIQVVMTTTDGSLGSFGGSEAIRAGMYDGDVTDTNRLWDSPRPVRTQEPVSTAHCAAIITAYATLAATWLAAGLTFRNTWPKHVIGFAALVVAPPVSAHLAYRAVSRAERTP
jgi:hypothetical protein